MSLGTYGIVRCADVSPSDVEIFYTYSKNRFSSNSEVFELDSNLVLKKIDNPNNVGEILGGLYNLELPTTVFNKKGIFNILIRPKRIFATIVDCGVLASNDNIKGIIFDMQTIDNNDQFRLENNGLIGYRVEFLNSDLNTSERKLQNIFRIITSNNKVEPITENLTNTSQKGVKYKLNDASTLVFCTVESSSASSVNPNAIPFIGVAGQQVKLIPTFFDPMTIELELVENDIDTLALGLFGNQSLSVQDGVRTIYNDEDEIFKQFIEYDIKDENSEEKLYEIRRENDTIDFSKDLDNLS